LAKLPISTTAGVGEEGRTGCIDDGGGDVLGCDFWGDGDLGNDMCDLRTVKTHVSTLEFDEQLQLPEDYTDI